MANRPSGTVTFLFTDIEGSTKLAQEYADAVGEKIGDHRPPFEQASVENDLAVIHSKVKDDEYSKLYTEGQALTTEQVIPLGLEG